MASARDLAVKRGETVNYYTLDQLETVPELNARDLTTPDNVAHIEWLANEIETKGFTSVMKVILWDGKIVVTEGHCRTAACQLLQSQGKWPEDRLLPALSEPKGTGVEDLVARQMSGNGTSKALNTEEAAANIKRMMSFGKNVSQVAKLVGRSTGYVENLLAFQGAPTEVHKMVADGAVSLSTAAKTIRKKGATAGVEALKAGTEKAAKEGRKRATINDVAPIKPKVDIGLFNVVLTSLRLLLTGTPTAHDVAEARKVLAKADKALGL